MSAIVRQETKWLRHYVGSVLDTADTLHIGRVQVAIQELGFTDSSMGVWACPRQGNSMSPPAVGEWVEVYFISGDPSRPVYLPGAVEHMLGSVVPSGYTDPSKPILFQDPIDSSKIDYDESSQQLNVLDLILFDKKNGKVTMGSAMDIDETGGKIKMIGGTEAFVLGTTFNTFMGQLMTWLGTHTHTSADPGSSTSPPVAQAPALPTITSTVITGK